jgi:hypothetical protein
MVYNFGGSCCNNFSLANGIVTEKFNRLLNSDCVFNGATKCNMPMKVFGAGG